MIIIKVLEMILAVGTLVGMICAVLGFGSLQKNHDLQPSEEYRCSEKMWITGIVGASCCMIALIVLYHLKNLF